MTDTEHDHILLRRRRRLIADHALYMSLPCSLLPAFMIVGLWAPVDATVMLTAVVPVVFLTVLANAIRMRSGISYLRYNLTLWPCTALVITLFTYCTLMAAGGHQCMALIEKKLLAADIPDAIRSLLMPLSSDPRIAASATGAALIAAGWAVFSPIAALSLHLYYNMKNRVGNNQTRPTK